MDISETTIHQFPYDPTRTWALNTIEFDYRLDIVRSDEFQWRESRVGQHPDLRDQESHTEFCGQVLLAISAELVSPTQPYNVLRWDCAVIFVALVSGFEIDFAHMLIAETHERGFKASTNYPFSCLIFQLFKDFGVPVWHYDRLIQSTKILDIGLIWDEANVAAPRREPHVDIPPLGADLVADVEQMPDPTPPATTDDSPASLSLCRQSGS
uniref:Putative plant transposon protein domain-containing protein n=1 Tax=Solanum tuberosum TaxID=4113 RepID=M1DQX3_SOLTU